MTLEQWIIFNLGEDFLQDNTSEIWWESVATLLLLHFSILWTRILVKTPLGPISFLLHNGIAQFNNISGLGPKC